MNRRSLITVVLMTLLAVSYSGNAEAQFWKKKKHAHKKHQKAAETTTGKQEGDSNEDNRTSKDSDTHELSKKEKKELRKKEKRERKEREREERRQKKEREAKDKKGKSTKKVKKPAPEAAAPAPSVYKSWASIEYVPTRKKEHYRIELLAPLFLDELVKNGYATKDIPDKAQTGLNFYKGVQIAADSLKKANFNIDIYVHDVASLLESADMLVRKNVLDTADLIIGAVPGKDVPLLANYARGKHVNFVSATSPADGTVRDNQYFTMLQPSLRSHCEWIADAIAENRSKGKALLFHRTYIQADDNAYRYLTEDTNARKIFLPVLCNNLPKPQDIAGLIDTAGVNTVVVAVMDITYADSVLRVLKHDYPRTRFNVYGMPTWGNMTSIVKPGMYPNLSINITTPFIYDPSNASIQYVDKVYRKEYGGKPQEMVYRGYEVMFWYANLLMRHGTIFNKQYSNDEVAPMTKFEIRPQWDNAGNVLYMENRRIYVHRYENGAVETLRQ